MKKITYLISILFFLSLMSNCTGYQPIYGSTDFKFKIAEYTIEGNKKIGNKLYAKLNKLSKSQKNLSDTSQVFLTINVEENKKKMASDTAGQTIEYEITINATVNVKNYITNNNILNQTFSSSALYRVKEQYSDTIKAENKTIEELIQNLYQKILINLSEKITQQ